MHTPFRTLAILSLLFTCGCSTVIEGRSQQITVNSSPQGAQCLIEQAGDVLGRVTTPGSAEIPKSKNDLVILCSKPGYESASYKNRSDVAITSLGNMVLGQFSFVGNAMDSASGASNKYSSNVFVRLAPAATPAVFPAPPGAPPVVELPMQVAEKMSMQVPMPGAIVPPAPQAPTHLAAPIPAAAIDANPALHAAAEMGKAAHPKPLQQVAQLSYAQALVETTRRPPFEITQ